MAAACDHGKQLADGSPLVIRPSRIAFNCSARQARSGRQSDSGVTVAELLDAYVPVAGWDVSTEETNLGYIRRTIKPALGTREVRKVRGPLLDNLYARLQQCGNLACAGKPFIEHRHVPDLLARPS